MRKLKYILLFVILIFGLNSCLTTMVGWGICEEIGCDSFRYKKTKINDYQGILVYFKNKQNKGTENIYLEDLKKRKKIKIKLKSGSYITVPQNFVLKDYDNNTEYLLDTQKNIGLNIRFLDKNNDSRKEFETYIKMFDGTNNEYKTIYQQSNIRKAVDKELGIAYIIKKLSETEYAVVDFYKEPFPINEIHKYVIENL